MLLMQVPLTSLNLFGEQLIFCNKTNKINLLFKSAENEIGTEGACALSEALKTNTTLTKLNFECGSSTNKTIESISNSTDKKPGNEIYHGGVYALGEALKVNSTLAALKLSGA